MYIFFHQGTSPLLIVMPLSDFLGQGRVLGVGALLVWLVLFHLLVNVWLLCIFTSLLVVLGGWLGSRALLDANSVLHLEHFLPLGNINPPQCSPEHEWRLNHEIHSAVHKAVRDFVSSWYRTLLPEVEGDFERVVRNSMLESVMELKERARRVDRKVMVQRLLELYGSHLQNYMTVRHIQSTQKESMSLWQLYREVDTPHPAVSSETAELGYSRALVHLVLHVLIPYPQMETRTGGYMVTELITCNLLLPLISRISEPDWLNQTIVDIFTRCREPPQEISADDLPAEPFYKCQIEQESWATCKSLSSSDQAGLTSRSTSDLGDLSESRSTMCERDSSLSSLVSVMSAGKLQTCSAGLLAPYKVSCCPLTSAHCSNSSESKIISLDSLAQSDSDDDLTGRFCECGPSNNFCSMLNPKDDDAYGCFAPLRNLGQKAVVPVDSQWPAGIAQEKSPGCPRRRLCLPSFNFDAPNSAAAPANIQNVRISGTVAPKEQRGAGAHPNILYTVKVMPHPGAVQLLFELMSACKPPLSVCQFDTVTDPDSSVTLQPAARHTVNRRYSEFLNLQTRLEEKPEIKKLIKSKASTSA